MHHQALLRVLSLAFALFVLLPAVAADSHDVSARRHVSRHELKKRCPAQNKAETTSTHHSTSTHHTTSTKKSTPTPATVSTESTGSKTLILPWSNGKNTISKFYNSHVAFTYSWSIFPPDDLPKGARFCPMFSHAKAGSWKSAVKGHNCVLHVNEPELNGISPESAAQWFDTYLAPLRSEGFTLIGGPAITTAQKSLPWLKEFYSHCKTCKTHMTHQVFHMYDFEVSKIKSFANEVHALMPNLHILLTEVACESFAGGGAKSCSSSQAKALVEGVAEFVRETSWMDAYGWFGLFPPNNMPGRVGSSNSMMSSKGLPNALADIFLKG